jgi:hypothetical protein
VTTKEPLARVAYHQQRAHVMAVSGRVPIGSVYLWVGRGGDADLFDFKPWRIATPGAASALDEPGEII